ncbi:serine hydrolase domain-containing protein [Gilvimarinus sp. SDUM040013]|uniref:Serine hydrolase domain-containing protein n=1 Tax=Gilvimarinus gilvus TaxID=3058038 RepID=A0ABU4S475_9GAMM|nr:serine hydrolase domain-containing protein [Gilvimarinus sp. SDUM040013]MDO3385835.1 serine hydrolase domain-containing protein [Gilvimarinus sp. SDUM040013]MDX6851376.1 serine hydrolase domain-containing protein [Gilvimarinus sp. SDUM040013]
MKRFTRNALAILVVTILIVVLLAGYFIRPWVPVQSIKPLTDRAQTSMTFDPRFTEVGESLQRHLVAWRDEYTTPSLSVAIGYRGELVWAGAVGHVNVDSAEPVTLDTAYRIGSVSKTLLSTAMATATNQKLVSLDKPIEAYRSDYPHKGSGVTLRKLLSHQAGIRHYGMMWSPPFAEYYINESFKDVNHGLELFIEDRLLYPPGERFAYSSYGYNLASGVLESATDKNFLALMKETVFGPLGMETTAAEGTQHSLRTASWYDQVGSNSGVRASAPTNASYKWAGGGFLSTPSDMVRLANAWLNETLFDQHTREIYWTPQKLNNGAINPQSYALGWRVESKHLEAVMGEEAELFVHHGGTASGSSAFLLIFPEHELVIAATANLLEQDIRATPETCFEAAYIFAKWLKGKEARGQ